MIPFHSGDSPDVMKLQINEAGFVGRQPREAAQEHGYRRISTDWCVRVLGPSGTNRGLCVRAGNGFGSCAVDHPT